MPTTITAYNGKVVKQEPTVIKPSGCAVQIIKHKVKGTTVYLTLKTFEAGRISGGGRGLKSVHRKLGAASSTVTLRGAAVQSEGACTPSLQGAPARGLPRRRTRRRTRSQAFVDGALPAERGARRRHARTRVDLPAPRGEPARSAAGAARSRAKAPRAEAQLRGLRAVPAQVEGTGAVAPAPAGFQEHPHGPSTLA